LFRSPAEADASREVYNANVEVSGVRHKSAAIDALVHYVFGALRAENPGLKVIVVLDAPRPGIYGDPDPATDLSFVADIVGQAAAANGFEFIDLAPPMRAEYAATGIPFESRYDGHWDEGGHRFVAKTVLPFLEGVTGHAHHVMHTGADRGAVVP
jgi:hypothetical protein